MPHEEVVCEAPLLQVDYSLLFSSSLPRVLSGMVYKSLIQNEANKLGLWKAQKDSLGRMTFDTDGGGPYQSSRFVLG